MKSRFSSLVLLITLSTGALAQPDYPSNDSTLNQFRRFITGGLGYEFDMKLPDEASARSQGWLWSSKLERYGELTRINTSEYFSLHRLLFTKQTGRLLKIEGWRYYGGTTDRQENQCTPDWQAVSQAIMEKYPSIKRMSQRSQINLYREKYCEGIEDRSQVTSLFSPSGLGRCIELECRNLSNGGKVLSIEYWNNDIYNEAQAERKQWERENAELLLRERGLDKSKL